MSSSRADAAALVLVAAVVAFGFQGSRGLYETTEGRYAEVGREMAAGGDWLVPRLGGAPHWTKPPLTYWGVALGVEAFGATERGARAFNALAFLAWVGAAVWTGRGLFGAAVGRTAGWIAATSLFPALAAATISTDVLLSLWELLVVGAYARARRAAASGRGGAPGRARAWVVAAWTAAGLAFLTKGPPGLLSAAAVLGFEAFERRRGRPATPVGFAPALAAGAVVGGGWYVAVGARTPGLIAQLLREEVWGRVAEDRFHRNPEWYKPLVVYGPPLVLGPGVWAGAVVRAWGRGGAARARRALRAPGGRLLAAWVVSSLAILSLSRSRLPFYVLPVFGAVVLGAAVVVTPAAAAGNAFRRRVRRTAAAGALLLVLAKGVAARVDARSDMRALHRAIGPVPPGTRVAFVDTPDLYGLQFYLARDVVRARSGRVHAPREIPLAALAERIRAAPPGPWLVLEPGRRAPELPWPDGWTVSTRRARGYRVVAARPGRPPGPDGHAAPDRSAAP